MALQHPSPLVGEGGSRSETDEGFLTFCLIAFIGWRKTPHPALTGHLLSQGEKEDEGGFVMP